MLRIGAHGWFGDMAENRHTRRASRRGPAHALVARRATPKQAFFVLLALVSLAFQTFVVQTHIHHRMAQFAPIPGISALTGDITDIAAPSEDGQTKQGPRDPF